MEIEREAVHVNFGKPFPVFPLARVSLFPHALLRLFIFEPRYRQMVEHALDTRGQIAMASFEGDAWRRGYHDSPAIREAVCLGQIEDHEGLADGTSRIVLRGVCRARVVRELKPDGEHLYRRAVLEPLEPAPAGEEELAGYGERIWDLLSAPPMDELASASSLIEQVGDREVPAPVLMELATLSVLSDNESQYELLAEPDAFRRAERIERELEKIRRILSRAPEQVDPEAPEGVTWN